MDFSLNENQLNYLETVRKLVKNDITPHILEMEKKHKFPWEIINKAWEMGIINLCIPESVKGYEIDIISSALIIKELSYGDTGISTSAMCNDLANVVVSQHGTDEQKELYLKPFVEKPLLASFCLTEPNAGSDNSMMTSFMVKQNDGTYLLNGSKCFITNASYASQYTVICKVGKPTSNFMACVVIPVEPVTSKELPDVGQSTREINLSTGGKITIGKPEDKLGQRLSNTASITFEDVIVQPRQIIGDRRFGFKYIVDVLDYARPMVAAIGLGLAKRALDLTLQYTQERVQFNQRICDLPVARDMLTAMWKKVELAEMALLKAVYKIQEKAPDAGIYASLAKNTAAEAALFCANEGLHLHGGYGFTTEYEISKLARDAHIIDIYEGVREVQNMIIGREIV
ncbi:MAG TPA: acyl-CoA dehydrogenase family protein [Smithellaceae bacterium]|jgi:acyl-CoA dehydrogenase|nr:MAG: Acyl-CoA dehydrogenase, short-chain specific [Deltaproteobacteria bacterium ADurb.BinA014]HNQ17882.1 acyl-CoA dehydrogenase family protein [Smithellaceae bacterium]HNT90462.1 acyl-CoA dehydrogenase family protein [Smithellaceae bacterium]HNV63694.1 acyl-CoA dehydrogenase family protein [Smithellaceae bacterium]HNZ31332.1 acyl-CoA dehydrogenase family protein [Smithellaceae bacterium]